MKKMHLTATKLRLILSGSLFVITLIAGVGFSLTDGTLQTMASDVSHTTVDANASRDALQTLQKIQQQLSDDKDVVARASSIVAESQSYQYQDQIVNDLNDYAKKAGISITNLDFGATSTAATPAAPVTTTPTPTGVKSTAVTVTLKNPVNYNSLLHFFSSIEQNLTKMQISKIGISKGNSGNDVSSDILTIQVYIR
jgi:hypothetical protein